MSDEIARLVADVFGLAGLLRRSGEVVAAREGHTQARWQLLSVVSDRALTSPAARRLGVTCQVQRVANDLVVCALAELRHNPDHRTSPLLVLTGEWSPRLPGNHRTRHRRQQPTLLTPEIWPRCKRPATA